MYYSRMTRCSKEEKQIRLALHRPLFWDGGSRLCSITRPQAKRSLFIDKRVWLRIDAGMD